jgi:drug/metabolite transporter (DMT)-like permease
VTDIPRLGEILALSAALCWAFGVVLFKRAGESVPPLSLNLFKGCVGLVLLTPTIPLFGGDLFPAVPWTTWAMLMFSGFLGIAVADTMFFISLERLGAGLTAVVDTSYTPILIGLSYVWLGERLTTTYLVGAALIVSGLLVGGAERPPAGKTRSDLVIGSAIGVTGILVMGVGIVMVKPLLNELPVLWSAWVRLLGGTAGVVPFMVLHRDRRALFGVLRPSPSWRWAVPASVLGPYLAMTSWIGGMKLIAVSRATLLNQLSTIFLFVLATVILKEPLTSRRALAVALALGGAVLVVS